MLNWLQVCARPLKWLCCCFLSFLFGSWFSVWCWCYRGCRNAKQSKTQKILWKRKSVTYQNSAQCKIRDILLLQGFSYHQQFPRHWKIFQKLFMATGSQFEENQYQLHIIFHLNQLHIFQLLNLFVLKMTSCMSNPWVSCIHVTQLLLFQFMYLFAIF